MTKYKRLSEARGALVVFLKKNPFSTTAECYQAVGITPYAAAKKGLFKHVTYEGKKCWRVTANPEQFI